MTPFRPTAFPADVVSVLGTSAIGRDAETLEQSIAEAGIAGPNSVLTQRISDAVVALLEAATAASAPNWDGYRSQPISVGSFFFAEALLRTIPPDVPMPDIDVHPDGQVGLDWLFSRRRMFSLAIDALGTIAFAGMCGEQKVTGRDSFTGTFPPAARFHLSCILAGHE